MNRLREIKKEVNGIKAKEKQRIKPMGTIPTLVAGLSKSAYAKALKKAVTWLGKKRESFWKQVEKFGTLPATAPTLAEFWEMTPEEQMTFNVGKTKEERTESARATTEQMKFLAEGLAMHGILSSIKYIQPGLKMLQSKRIVARMMPPDPGAKYLISNLKQIPKLKEKMSPAEITRIFNSLNKSPELRRSVASSIRDYRLGRSSGLPKKVAEYFSPKVSKPALDIGAIKAGKVPTMRIIDTASKETSTGIKLGGKVKVTKFLKDGTKVTKYVRPRTVLKAPAPDIPAGMKPLTYHERIIQTKKGIGDVLTDLRGMRQGLNVTKKGKKLLELRPKKTAFIKKYQAKGLKPKQLEKLSHVTNEELKAGIANTLDEKITYYTTQYKNLKIPIPKTVKTIKPTLRIGGKPLGQVPRDYSEVGRGGYMDWFRRTMGQKKLTGAGIGKGGPKITPSKNLGALDTEIRRMMKLVERKVRRIK